MIPQIFAILNSVSMILMIMAVKVLVTIHRISCHLIGPLEEQFVLNFLQNLLQQKIVLVTKYFVAKCSRIL